MSISVCRLQAAFAVLFLFGLSACAGVDPDPAHSGQPEANRFTKEVLVEGIDEPMQIEFDDSGRVYWIERTGGIRRIDPSTGQVDNLGVIPVAVVGEAGLTGFLLAQNFEESGSLYAYYSAPGDQQEMRLSRFTVVDGTLDLTSEIIMMRWPFDMGSHMGGGMTWDAKGNLYLSTGDNSDATQYTPIHWTEEGGRGEDAQRTAANTNDLRGKILRIYPEGDGSYSIPDGNLFVDEDSLTRPEIYTMGNRNPWRLSIDSETGYLHWGEVGPDAGADSAGIGPRGYDEFNVAKNAGNFGWPYFIGQNRAYNRYDRATKEYGAPFDPQQPVNTSPNNTGLEELPPARPSLLAYPYAVSDAYPMLGSGGRNAVGGPVFHQADFGAEPERVFPAYYEDAWFVVDFVRNWVMALRMNEERTEVTSVEPFLPEIRYNSPIDVDFGPEGDLYVLEYGTQWFQQNQDSRLSRIVYNAGNRAPVARAAADRLAGALPLRVELSSEGTVDYDGDELSYEWLVTPPSGGTPATYSEPNPAVTLEKAGAYTAKLTVADPEGARSTESVTIVAGNEPPEVEFALTEGNSSFYFPGESIAYDVRVSDHEDGRLGEGIPQDRVTVTSEYVRAGMTPSEAQQVADLDPSASARNLRALRIIEGSDCSVCHTVDQASAGPSFRDVAERYRDEKGASDHLTEKILRGGSGVWGEAPMPAHPTLSRAEARTLSEYVLGLADETAAPQRIGTSGRFTTDASSGDGENVRGSYVLRASYTDESASGVAPITASDVVLLRDPFLEPQTADHTSGVKFVDSRDPGFFIEENGAFVGFEGLDLTGIDSVNVHVMTRFYTWSHFVGGTVELRLGSPTGELVGSPLRKMPASAKPNAGSGEGGDNAPGAPVFFGSDPAAFDVSGLSGRHDVYVVFRNETAGRAPLFLLTGVEFRRGRAA